VADAQFLKTPSGDELVALTRADCDALVALAAEAEEDAADVAIYDACKAEREAGRAPDAPAEVTTAMLRGESLLKAIRKWRGMSQTDLAAKAGIGQGYRSDLESRRRQGTTETLEALARALEIDPAWLLP
jgi:ribosome-binding protein aMBF1 (putative translation factor)